MGADLILASMPAFDIEKPGRREAILAELQRIPAEVYKDNMFIGDKPEEDMTVSDYAAEALLCLDSVDEHARDTTWVSTAEMDWNLLVSGGMSWGDSPTDTFDNMAPAAYSHALWELLITYAKEDHAEHTKPLRGPSALIQEGYHIMQDLIHTAADNDRAEDAKHWCDDVTAQLARLGRLVDGSPRPIEEEVAG